MSVAMPAYGKHLWKEESWPVWPIVVDMLGVGAVICTVDWTCGSDVV